MLQTAFNVHHSPFFEDNLLLNSLKVLSCMIILNQNLTLQLRIVTTLNCLL